MIRPRLSYTLMAKPTGPRCNLRCDYCFYLDKRRFFPNKAPLRMTPEVLEAYVRRYIETNDSPEVVFSWQGGEPTLMGLDFFRKAVALQGRYRNGKIISNTLQTNGILLNDEWCRFLAQHGFLVGLSLDGPREIHDRFRTDGNGKPTFDRTLQALERMTRHGVEFNVLACIHRESSKQPREIYRFFTRHGIRFIQFIPVVETIPAEKAHGAGAHPTSAAVPEDVVVAPWAVPPEAYGDFLIGVFDEWVRQDVGRVFVMNFEWTLASWVGAPHASCSHAAECGQALILEHNGDVYSCDHYMFPEYRLGNILTDDLGALVVSERQRAFGESKKSALPDLCRRCEMLFACHGGCPKYRFARSPDGTPGLNYLCPGTKRYVEHVRRPMDTLAEFLRRGIPVTRIMALRHGTE